MRWDVNDTWTTPWGAFDELRREMFRLLDGYGVQGEAEVAHRTFPPVNVWESESAYHLDFEVPGVSPQSVEITVDARTLTIQGKRSEHPREEGVRALRSERPFGEFKRSFELGADVDAATVKANYKNGVLFVEIPKRNQARKVAISVN